MTTIGAVNYLKSTGNRPLNYQVRQDIAKGIIEGGLENEKILLNFNDERLKDPFKQLDHNGSNAIPNNKDWTLVCSYNGFFAFQYGKGDYLQIYRLTPGYAEIFSKACDKQQTLRKDFSTGEVGEIKD